MTLTNAVLCAAMALTISTPVLAAKALSDKEMLRQQAEHVCYNDATSCVKRPHMVASTSSGT